MAMVFVSLGSLKASVNSSCWSKEAKTIVKSGKENRIKIHRVNDTAIEAIGRLVAPLRGIAWSAGQPVDRFNDLVTLSVELK